MLHRDGLRLSAHRPDPRPSFHKAVPASLVLIIGVSALLGTTPIGNALAGGGRVGTTAAISFAAFVSAVVAALVLVPAFDALGAALAISGACVLSACLLLAVARRRFDLRIADGLPALVLPAVGVGLGSNQPRGGGPRGFRHRPRLLHDRRDARPHPEPGGPAMTLKSPNAALLLAATATALATLGSVVDPLVVVAAVGATAAGYVAAKAPVRYLLAALLAYIPAEPTILTYAPAGASAALRFGPEALVDFVVLWRVLPHVIAGRRQLRPLALPSLGVLVLWTASVVWNGTGVTTALIGVHSEFRFAVVALAVMVSAVRLAMGACTRGRRW